MIEVWKKYFDWPYMVSNLGRVTDMKGNIKVLQKHKCKKDYYYRITLYNNGVKKKEYVHRMVGFLFVDGYDNSIKRTEINHLNKDTLNNIVENLQWVTHSENVLHSYENS